MASSSVLLRQCFMKRPRRHLSNTTCRKTSTSPQRYSAAPALETSVKPFTDIPGPLALPMLRHSAHVLPRIGSFHHTVGLGLLDGLRDRYGDLVRLAKASRTRPVLYVFNPEIMQEVYDSRLTEIPRWDSSPLSKHRQDAQPNSCPVHGGRGVWDRSRVIRKAALEGLGGFAEEGAHEHCARLLLGPACNGDETSPRSTACRPEYSKALANKDETRAVWAEIKSLLQDGTLVKNYEKSFNEIAHDATRRLGELRHSGNALNEEIETEVCRWALETLGMMIFGIRLGCLDGPAYVPVENNRKKHITSIDDDAPELCSLSRKSPNDLTQAERLVMTSREIFDQNLLVRNEGTLRKDSEVFNKALKAFDRHYSLIQHFLEQAQTQLNSNDVKPEQTLLDKLRSLDKQLLPLAADIMLAGVDPLCQTAVSMLHQLSLHAAQQQRAHDEGRWAAHCAAVGLRPATPYLAACAREALRLQPATGGVVRRAREPMVVAGYEVPAGVDIVLAHGVSSNNEKQWGRAKAFIPERWCSDSWQPWQSLKASRAHPLASMPFGENCPASGVVGSMLAALATNVLDQYRLEWHGPAPAILTSSVNRLQPPYYFVLQNAA